MISIRKASIKDLETIQTLNNKLAKKENKEFDKTVNPVFATTDGGSSYFKKALEGDDSIIIIAEDDENPIGYITAGIYQVGSFRTIPNFCEVENMWVDESYRNQGIGKQLMDEVERWTRDRGIERMRVVASYDNKKGINFYKREGFVEYDLILEKDIQERHVS